MTSAPITAIGRFEDASNSPARDRGTWVATIQNHVVGYLVYQLITEPETSSSKVAGKAAKVPVTSL